MAAPTTQATNLEAALINSLSVRLTFNVGNGERRLVAVTKGSDVKYPINGVKYEGSLKYETGDQLIAIEAGTEGDPYPYPYPDPDPEDPETDPNSLTYVVYEGFDNGQNGLDIIELNPGTTYTIMVFEHDNFFYSNSTKLVITTHYAPNTRRMDVRVYDNNTRKIIKEADVAIKDRRGFIAAFGKTDNEGRFRSSLVEEGRYEMSVVANNYDPKIITGMFVQRKEPTRDNNYRIYTNTAHTEYGGTVERERYRNQNDYIVYLDTANNTGRSFTRYEPNDNPDHLTKL